MLDRAAPLKPRYDQRVRAWLVMLVACGGSSPQPSAPSPEPAPKRDLAVVEDAPKPTPPEEPELDPNDPSSRDAWIIRGMRTRPTAPIVVRRGPRTIQTIDLDVAESDLWSPCVKDYVHAQPEHSRRPLTKAFARYVVSCDASQHVVIEPPREYRGNPFVAIRGTLGGEVVVEMVMCGAATSVEKVALVYDGKRWVASTFDIERRDGCTIVRVPDTRALRRSLRDAIDANRAAVDFDGDEVPIGEDVERDLRLMLDALSAP